VYCAFLLLITLTSFAQKVSYPKDYFMFPINPGKANTLAGVLGDLRTNHFHGGLDIRTQQREGLPVSAAADGYVYKVAVQGTGYGNVIYLKHPNGMTTVYGHLKVFSTALAQYVKEEQYKKKDFYVDLNLEPGQFAFKKGEIIALSGNTGSSAGPHLHFEVRDSKDNYLNPLFFEFKEIKDATPPAFWNVALRPTTINSRVNAKFDRQVFKPVKLKDGSYRITQPIEAAGEVGIELQAYDYMTGTGFRYGLHCIEIKVDGKEVFTYNMEKFPSYVTRDYNNLIDYRTDQESGSRFLRCYNPDGNGFELYKTDDYQGKLQIWDKLEHDVVIKIYDAYENSSVLRFTIKGESNESAWRPGFSEVDYEGRISSDRSENVLVVEANEYTNSKPFATFYSGKAMVQKLPSYYQNSNAVFLADLRELRPDSVVIGKSSLPLYYKGSIAPGRAVEVTSPKWVMNFDSSSLFDTLHLAVDHRFNTIRINEFTEPLKYYVQVKYKPEGVFLNRERTSVYRYHKNDYSFVGSEWEEDFLSFKTRELGTFVALTDSTPPTVRLIEHSKNRIRAYIHDELSGIGEFRAFVNGEWVLMNYEYKSRYIWSDKLDENQSFEGELTLEVKDRAGNSTILRVEIK
jgi:hypothetical protein